MTLTGAPNSISEFGWRKPHPRRIPPPSRPARPRFCTNSRWRRNTSPPRVGADLCVRPLADPTKNRVRADTQVGPYGVQQAVPSTGPMYLRHGFRRPNFVPKFGASVMGIGPYGTKGRPYQPPWPAERLRQRSQGVGLGSGRDHPQSVQQPRTIPQSACG